MGLVESTDLCDIRGAFVIVTQYHALLIYRRTDRCIVQAHQELKASVI